MDRSRSRAPSLVYGHAAHFRSCLAAITLGAVGLSSIGCGATATDPPEATEYFPLAVGNTWTYAPEDPLYGQPFEWEVTGRRGDTVTLVRPEGASHSGTVSLLDHRDDIDISVGPEDFVPFYRFVAGESWIHRDPWECDDGARMEAVMEPNPIVTPAGTFPDCIRIERQTPASCSDAGTIVEWWAPNVGLVRWEELNFYAGGPITFHVTDYSVD